MLKTCRDIVEEAERVGQPSCTRQNYLSVKKTIYIFSFSFFFFESVSQLSALKSVRVKGGMSLRNGMWHGLRNYIITRNVKYGNWRKEIN